MRDLPKGTPTASTSKYEKSSAEQNLSPNAVKVADMLRKRRETIAKGKVEKKTEMESNKEDNLFVQHANKDTLPGEEEASSEESEDDQPATLTDNSDSYDSNDELKEENLQEIRLEVNSTSDDDDEITWVRLPEAKITSVPLKSKQYSNTAAPCHQSTPVAHHNQQQQHHHHHHHQIQHREYQEDENSSSPTKETRQPPGKPPRPSIGSLDRRRSRSTTNRQDRDSKSRSTHSLRDKALGGSKGSLSDARGKDTDTSNSNGNRRKSPAFYAPPPPTSWDHHYYNNHVQSREDLRVMEFYRRPCDPQGYRYGSCQDLMYNHHPSTLSLLTACENGCCNRYPPSPHGPTPFCPPNPYYGYPNQRQDSTSERVRRLQSDKDALNLQVQILNEQLAAQNDKMQDMERALNEKNHMLTNAEDLLQREMLSRSSLETQKLELMSAMSELKLQQAALERDNLELRSTYIKNSLTNLNNNALFYNKRPPTGTNVRNLNGTSSPQHTNGNNGTLHGSHGNLPQSLSVTHKSSPEFYRQRDNIHYSSLPRQSFATSTMLSLSSSGAVNNNSQIGSADNSMTMSSPKRNVAFADADKIIDDSIDIPQRNYSSSVSSPAMSQKHKGLRGIFGKIKGNNNNNNVVEDLDGSDGDFRRGGFRATAGPRLGWSGREKVAKPFREWDPSMLCMWFEEMGLDQYNEDLCRWLKDGPGELITCAPQDIDKELNIKSPLHRKKILLALADITEQETDELFRNAAKLDTSWVLRWLEDIGLPQHKDEFFNARVDGRMLHKLTMDDLITLHVTSSLHAASLRRGIQLMRENKWNPDCLIRRSSGDVEKMKIAYWTSFCVMEWLKVVDLSEYAPNLRGAGVHGALLVYEVKFTAELLADLLAIPSSKTLLRRHLLTHFKELIGRDVIQGKRDAENTLGYQPLTISAKLKTPKKSQFSLKRKKSAKNEDFNNDFSNFVCPFGASSGENNKPPAILNATNNAITVTTPTKTLAEVSTKVKAP